jgi:hypothetical protein
VGSGRHHQTGDFSSRYACTPKVVQHAFVPPVKQWPGWAASGAGPATARHSDAPGAATDDDRPALAEQRSTNRTPKVPQQRRPSRTPSVYPNAYRAR